MRQSTPASYSPALLDCGVSVFFWMRREWAAALFVLFGHLKQQLPNTLSEACHRFSRALSLNLAGRQNLSPETIRSIGTNTSRPPALRVNPIVTFAVSSISPINFRAVSSREPDVQVAGDNYLDRSCCITEECYRDRSSRLALGHSAAAVLAAKALGGLGIVVSGITPNTSFIARSRRHAWTRRCRVRSCAVPR